MRSSFGNHNELEDDKQGLRINEDVSAGSMSTIRRGRGAEEKFFLVLNTPLVQGRQPPIPHSRP